ncbi:capsid assembly scaffolding protein Gp46 family protein [Jonquetella sp. BV3C21]|uniref:capsid assembly scaffolding protein Gp46 family protein n=1 Tax=Jonquetella sp. BV3C21 TaxID=1111126 RepID=UPI0003AD9828|nr:DUF4355 domain-containing protein [Jonquetella sp. BV3C21]ERL23953.1 PF14265 domain protein [Jonquetella sp. BV3C21]
MAESTNNQNQNISTTNTAASAGEKTFTQADVDRVVADRLERERKKYADYDALKAAKAELDKLKEGQMSEHDKAKQGLGAAQAKVTELEAKIKAMELSALKARLAAAAGLPSELADRVRGEDEEAIKADIEALKKIIPAKSAGGAGTPAAGAKASDDLQMLYANALKSGNIEEAMIYKKQLFEKIGG